MVANDLSLKRDFAMRSDRILTRLQINSRILVRKMTSSASLEVAYMQRLSSIHLI
jgi:hypothetical protein